MQIATQALAPPRNIASTRILRMAVGITLALAFSQAVNWSASFIAPVFTFVILSLPLPAPSLAGGFRFVLVLLGSLLFGLALLPMLHHQPAAGVLLIILAIFGCFLYGARGGSPVLSMFLLMGATVVPAVGSESIDGAIAVTGGITIGASVAVLFTWVSFAIFPDPEAIARSAAQPPPQPSLAVSARSALRSTAIVAPVLLWMLMATGTAGYAAALIKVASMGQQVSHEGARAAGRDLILSTLIGGVAAIVIWNVLQIWPTLVIYCLLFLLCCLLMGPKIFAGRGLAPNGSTWSYGLLTMMVIVAPAVLDGAGGSDAGGAFSDRIVMFLLATIYAVAAVYVFDHLWPARDKSHSA